MKFFLNSLFVLLSACAFSQTQISGIVTDTLGAPIPFAAIGLVLLPDSTVVKGTLTDESGKYSMAQFGFGKYIVKSSVIGYLEKTTEAFTIDSTTNKNLLFNLKLSSSPQTLNEVSVYAIKKTIESKNGNTIVNVENSPLAKGNSVYDLLIKLPGVSVVDDNKIMIQGKAGVIVMIDDRPQRLSGDALINLLKSMNADLIKSIEILKNPPVKYDASGTSGMINIISKTVTVAGLTGTVFSSYSQGFYERLMYGASLNYKSKKIIFYSNLSGEYGHYGYDYKFNKRFYSDTGTMIFNTENINKDVAKTLNYKVGLDWMLTNVDVLGVKIEGNSSVNISKTSGRNSVSGDNNLGFDYMNISSIQSDKWKSNNFNLNYEHKLDTVGSSFVFITDYTDLPGNLANENINIFYNQNDVQVLHPNNYRSNNENISNVLSGRSDFVKIIDSLSSFESGLKAVSVKTSNNYLFERDFGYNGIYSKDTNISNDFQYQEVTYAGYCNYSRTIKKINIQLGARLEKTFLTGESTGEKYKLNKKYFQLFPNLSFSYKRKKDHEFQLNLSRRTNRPNFSDLNPFIGFIDPYLFQQGNPYLLPDFTSRGEFSYNFKGMFSSSLAYSHTQNIIMQYTAQDDSAKTTIKTVKNMKSSNTIEYSLFYQKSIIQNWDVSISGSFARMDYKGDINGIDFHQTGIHYYANLSNIILLAKNAKLELNGMYMGPYVYGIVQLKPKWMASLAVKTSLCKNNLDLTVGIDDIFHTFINRVETNYQNQNWSITKINDSRRFRVSLNYKFGKIKIAERSVKPSNEQEKQRLKRGS